VCCYFFEEEKIIDPGKKDGSFGIKRRYKTNYDCLEGQWKQQRHNCIYHEQGASSKNTRILSYEEIEK
jgi:hypothetical protein